MIFPEIAPSRSECMRQIQEAFRSDGARIYVDASVLIHCYEMSRSAREELLNALDSFGPKVRIPVWSAKETWDHTRALRTKWPLKATAKTLSNYMARFRSESLRYVDERTFGDMSMEQFSRELDGFLATGEALAKRAEHIDPGHDDANARLLPFIAGHALTSDMTIIYDEVNRTGEARYSHDVPPGFGDGGVRTQNGEGEEGEGSAQLKGKKRNRFGDLIMWLEALQDCGAPEAKHLVIVTRDNTKKDWVYNPERVATDEGGLLQNGGLITLPLPLLAQEAKFRCPHLEGIHVISLEMLTHILRTGHGARVTNLVRALQPDVGNPRGSVRDGRAERRGESAEGEPVAVSFGSSDMIFEPGEDTEGPVWRAVNALRAEGWSITNAAAAALTEYMHQVNADQAKQIGRGIVAASNDDALKPIELAQHVLNGDEYSAEIRANLLVGMLGETYFDENGEPRKPTAHSDITGILFDHAGDADTRVAYEATIATTLDPFRKLYLALPGEPERGIPIELQLSGSRLIGCQADGKDLLEMNAPESRQLVSGGKSEEMPVTDLLAALAREFVVPETMLTLEGPTNFQIELPERIGFVGWGPNSGELLR